MTKEQFNHEMKKIASIDWRGSAAAAQVILCMRYIESLEAENTNLKTEIAQLKKDKLEFNAQCFHKDETISVLKNRITELEFDNRSLVEQMNQMALKPNQEVIEWIYTRYNRETSRIYNLPTEERLCIIELFSGKYDIVWWISDGLDETGWDGYCVDEIKSWAYLPKGVTK